MDWKLLLGSSVLAAIIGAALKGLLDRRAAKKEPKTERRADAYRDLLLHLVRKKNRTLSTGTYGDIEDIHARLILYGESGVITAAAKLLNTPDPLAPDAEAELGALIGEMRKSLLTGHGAEVISSSLELLNTKPWA